MFIHIMSSSGHRPIAAQSVPSIDAASTVLPLPPLQQPALPQRQASAAAAMEAAARKKLQPRDPTPAPAGQQSLFGKFGFQRRTLDGSGNMVLSPPLLRIALLSCKNEAHGCPFRSDERKAVSSHENFCKHAAPPAAAAGRVRLRSEVSSESDADHTSDDESEEGEGAAAAEDSDCARANGQPRLARNGRKVGGRSANAGAKRRKQHTYAFKAAILDEIDEILSKGGTLESVAEREELQRTGAAWAGARAW